MFKSLHIQGYRALKDFRMEGLGRVNLLVGKNNGGKTSILEALRLLNAAGDPEAVTELISGRGELVVLEGPTGSPGEYRATRSNIEFDISHMFSGHDIIAGSALAIEATDRESDQIVSLTMTVEEVANPQLTFFELSPGSPAMALRMSGVPDPVVEIVPLTRNCGIRADFTDRVRSNTPRRAASRSLYITTESLRSAELLRLWDRISLEPDEDLVLKSIRLLHADIDRIAAQSGTVAFNSRSHVGFRVKLKSAQRAIPIGTMGDGIWRMLALSLALTQSKDGVLLIDEIDTGLHYSVLLDMWRLVYQTANDLNVQVFATTHSSDCVTSLAALCTEHLDASSDITLHRIDATKTKSVPYDMEEIIAAAESHIEVR